MRIYSNLMQAVREIERDLWEMGLMVHPQTMQDKFVGDNPNYATKELRHYAFQLNGLAVRKEDERTVIDYVMPPTYAQQVADYIDIEFEDRTSGMSVNPGNSYVTRPELWGEFLHNGKFSYTYSERMSVQLKRIENELLAHPETRQAIVNIHSNICPERAVYTGGVGASDDLLHMGGGARIPCSMYYQFLRRDGALDLAYTMRSCDFLTHFPVDLILALRLQQWMASKLSHYENKLIPAGRFTYFTGSLHAYVKDMKVRGVF